MLRSHILVAAVFAAVLAQINAAPLNDAFAKRTFVRDLTNAMYGSLFGATQEPSEPNVYYYSSADRTIWWSWQAQADGLAVIERFDSGASECRVYEGNSLTSLQLSKRGNGRITFRAAAGREYQFQFHNLSDNTNSDVIARVSLIQPPANDRYEQRSQITGTNLLIITSADAATADAVLPYEKHSLWWEWTSPRHGTVLVDCEQSLPGAYLDVFQPRPGGGFIRPWGSGYSWQRSAWGRVSEGSKYIFMVNGGTDSGTNQVVLRVRIPDLSETNNPAKNDHFTNRLALTGASVRTAGTLYFAGREAGEPHHGNSLDGATVWYTWRAPSRGVVRIHALSATTPRVAAYRGTALTNLVMAGYNSEGALQVGVSGGDTLEIAVADASVNAFELALDLIPSPKNDDFVDSTDATTSGVALFDTTGASVELGEPNHADTYSMARTVWYHWSQTTDGPVVTTAISSNTDPVIAVYRGTELGSLSLIASNANMTPLHTTARALFHGRAGETYKVAVGTRPGGGTGTVTITRADLPNVTVSVNPTNAVLQAGTPINIEAFATDPGGYVTNVTLFLNDTNWASFTSPPYRAQLDPPSPGAMRVFALASDNDGHLPISETTSLFVRSANDEFADRVSFGTNMGPWTVSLAGSSQQTNESFAASWWSWIAPSNGEYVVFAPQQGQYGHMEVYGVVGGTNVLLAKTSSSAVTPRLPFSAEQGREYAFARRALTGGEHQPATFLIAPGQRNDHFSNRIDIAAADGSVTGLLFSANIEQHEPRHGITTNFTTSWSSLWWSCTPLSDCVWVGQVRSSTPTVFDAYVGNTLTNLPRINLQNMIVRMKGGAPYAFSLSKSWSFDLDQIGSETVLDYRVYPAPANDDFAAATILTGTTNFVSAQNYGGTVETNDPGPAASLWWRWVAPRSGRVLIRTLGEKKDIRVYTGQSLSALTLVSSGSWRTASGERIEALFHATAGQTYHVAIGGGPEGSFDVTLSSEAPTNDNFANSIDVVGELPLTFTGNTVFAGFENGESLQNWVNPASMWWKWTPTETREVSVRVTSQDVGYPKVFVFTGSSLSQLVPVAPSASGVLTFVAKAGVTYRIAVAGNVNAHPNDFTVAIEPNAAPEVTIVSPAHGQVFRVGDAVPVTVNARDDGFIARVWLGLDEVKPASPEGSYTFILKDLPLGSFTVTAHVEDSMGAIKSAQPITIVVAPENDHFADAAAVLGGHSSGSIAGATKETGEPAHGSRAQGKTAWWKWVAPSTGRYVIDTVGSDCDTVLAVYSGNAVDALTRIASNDNRGGDICSEVTLYASAGTTYFIAIDTADGVTGEVRIHVQRSPGNDLFADATSIQAAVAVSARTTGATTEAGEPAHAGYPAAHSLWWKWVAPATGTYCISEAFTDYDARLAVYTGTVITNLTLVAEDDDSGPFNTGQVQFEAVSGNTYYIAVDGYGSAVGQVRFVVAPAQGVLITPVGVAQPFSIAGRPGRTVRIDASTNLSQWTIVDRQVKAGGWFNIRDTNTPALPMRFYRAVEE